MPLPPGSLGKDCIPGIPLQLPTLSYIIPSLACPEARDGKAAPAVSWPLDLLYLHYLYTAALPARFVPRPYPGQPPAAQPEPATSDLPGPTSVAAIQARPIGHFAATTKVWQYLANLQRLLLTSRWLKTRTPPLVAVIPTHGVSFIPSPPPRLPAHLGISRLIAELDSR